MGAFERHKCSLLAWQQLDSDFVFFNTCGKGTGRETGFIFLVSAQWAFPVSETDAYPGLDLEKGSIPRKHE